MKITLNTLVCCYIISVSNTAFGLITNTNKELTVGLASNFSEVSSSNSNPFGNYFLNGALLALKQKELTLNKLGVKVKLNQIDYGVNQLNVIPAIQKGIVDSNLIAILGFNYSSHAIIAAKFLNENKIPMITPSATATSLTKYDSYIHPTCFSNELMGKNLASLALNEFKAKNVISITAADCAYCQDLTDSFSRVFKSMGGSFSKIEILDSDSDYSQVIKKLKSEKFDLILVPNHELTSAKIISAIIDANIKVPFLGGDGWGNVGEEFFGIIKNRTFNGYSISHWNLESSDRLSKKFISDFTKEYKKMPNDTAVLAYDSMNYLLELIIKDKAYNKFELEKALSQKRLFNGVTGKTLFNNGKVESKNLVVLKIENKKFNFFKNVGGL